MATILTPAGIEVKKYLDLSKDICANILNRDQSGKYRAEDVDRICVVYDMIQIYTTNGGMVPISAYQVDEWLEEWNYIPTTKKIISNPDDPIEVVWENDSEGYTRNKQNGNTYRFGYADSRIYSESPGAQSRGTDKHYEAILESLGERPGAYDMEF